ncbi:MAG: ACP S-malonyltransferase [Zetaproteobacteria bacterium]|nr:ACP S-malonyltransferase [Zetaproteobacteria bacterium]
MNHIAFLFPGQGSQSKGMLADLIASEFIVNDTFLEASDLLGYDMKSLVLEDSNQQLDVTEYTQPALLTASIAMFRLWNYRSGVMASQMAGHSLGEYSALVAAGALTFEDGIALVAYRGRMMSESVAPGVGKMAAIIGLSDETIVEICEQCSNENDAVWAANFNCPGQLVVAGHADAVERLMVAAKNAGAKRALPLAVSAPSHTPLMQPAADAIQARLASTMIESPDIPVWSNALAAPLVDPNLIREALVQQLVSPVRWTETVEKLSHLGVTRAVEMGPGKVLAGLVRRIDKNLNVASVLTSAEMHMVIQELEAYHG